MDATTMLRAQVEGGSGVASKKELSEIGSKMVRAFGNPIRAQALIILGSRVASPREIAEELGEPIGKVSYHIRELRDSGLIELVSTDDSRGGVQHFYRATRLAIVDTEGMAAQSEAERAASSSVVINMMHSDLWSAMAGGSLDARPERVLIRHHAMVDEQGLREMSDLYTNALYEALRIHRDSRSRLRESAGEEGIPIAIHNLIFEMPDADLVAMDSSLEWLDEVETHLQDRRGKEGRGADDGGPEG